MYSFFGDIAENKRSGVDHIIGMSEERLPLEVNPYDEDGG